MGFIPHDRQVANDWKLDCGTTNILCFDWSAAKASGSHQSSKHREKRIGLRFGGGLEESSVVARGPADELTYTDVEAKQERSVRGYI